MKRRTQTVQSTRRHLRGSGHALTLGLLASGVVAAPYLWQVVERALHSIWAYLLRLADVETWHWLIHIDLPV